MKTKLKLHILAMSILLCAAGLQAQVSNYSFSQKVVDVSQAPDYIASFNGAVYLEYQKQNITNAGRYIYMYGVKDTNETLTGNGFPIGFDFNYDGQWMDELGISSNAYIKLGNSKKGNITIYNDTSAGGIFTQKNSALKTNIISAFQTNSSYLLKANMSINYYRKTGLPGNRDFRVQIGVGSSSTILYDVIIILREWKNDIQFYYSGVHSYLTTTDSSYCGLRGRKLNNNISNLNIRKVTSGINTWPSSIAGDSATSHCNYKSTLTPTKRLVYTFTPPALDTVRTPIAFFKCYLWDSIPNYIGTVTGSTEGYVMANKAIEIPNNAILSWSPEYTSSTNYYSLYFGLDSLDMNLLADSITATNYKLPVLASNTKYYYKIIAYNNTCIAKPCTGSFNTANELVYCSPFWFGNAFVKTLTFNSISYTNPSTSDDTRRVLPFETPYTTTLQRDSSYLFSTTPMPDVPCFSTRCWIDFNKDGKFNKTTEQFDSHTYVKVPHDAVIGTTKMRIGKMLCTYNASQFYACGGIQYQDYTVTIAPNGDCTHFSVLPQITPPSCFASSTGEIELNFSEGSIPYTIQWKKGGVLLADTTETLSNITRGTYQAFVTDNKDCSVQTDLLVLTQPLPIQIDTATVNDSLIIKVSGGTGTYTYQWNNNDYNITQSELALPDSAGTYSLSITDENNCLVNYDSVIVSVKKDTVEGPNTNLLEVKTINKTIQIYPNPTTGDITVSGSEPIYKIVIVNSLGMVVHTKNDISNGKTNLNINSLPTGIYLLKAYTKQGIETTKIKKK